MWTFLSLKVGSGNETRELGRHSRHPHCVELSMQNDALLHMISRVMHFVLV